MVVKKAMRKWSTSVVFSLCAAWTLVCLSPPVSKAGRDSAEIASAKALYYRAVSGDESARKQSTAEFERLAKRDPGDPEVMAYRGSLILLEAGKTWAVWRKYELSRQGVTLLDGAVSKAPDNLEVRFVRAATTRKLPAFFHRSQQSKEDLAYLAARAHNAAREGQLSPDLAAAAMYFYAKDVASGEQKAKALEQAVKIAPESQAGRDAAITLSAAK